MTRPDADVHRSVLAGTGLPPSRTYRKESRRGG